MGISQFMWVKVHSLNGLRMIRSPCLSHHEGGFAATTVAVTFVVDLLSASVRDFHGGQLADDLALVALRVRSS